MINNLFTPTTVRPYIRLALKINIKHNNFKTFKDLMPFYEYMSFINIKYHNFRSHQCFKNIGFWMAVNKYV